MSSYPNDGGGSPACTAHNGPDGVHLPRYVRGQAVDQVGDLFHLPYNQQINDAHFCQSSMVSLEGNITLITHNVW